MKNTLFHFIVSVRSLAPRDTHFQNTKNSFLSLILSVRLPASYDTYFQVIQKIQKNIKFSKYKKHQHFQTKVFLRTT